MIQWYVCTLSFYVPVLVPFLPGDQLAGGTQASAASAWRKTALRPVGSYLQILDQSFVFCSPLTRPR